jgi:predicted pyridoxine 5'-phosphate oxidase superfamily flavin-nucleotide-binding protein
MKRSWIFKMGTFAKDTEINEGMKKMINESLIMALATVNKKGEPHNIAVGYVQIVPKNQLLISDNWINESIDNIKSNSNVSLAVWNKNWEEACIGYEFRGKAEYFTSGKWVDEIKKLSINKGEPCKGAILITITKIKVLD